MAQSRVASRYAKALLDLAKESNVLDRVYNDISLLQNTLVQSKELTSLMSNPVLPQAKKKSIFSAIFQDKMDKMSFGFFDLVLGKRRESDIKEIAESFIHQYNNEKGITKVELTTAVPIDAATEQSIINKIKQTANLNEIQLHKTVDESIIGGFIVEFNNRILDNSIQSNLNTIKRRYSAN